MRSLALAFITVVFISLTSSAQPAKHVIIISLDGFRPDFYKDPSWGAVNLRQLMEKGVHADGVRSVFPSVTYPSHTAVMTGALPARHGIYYNVIFEPGEPPGRWYWDYSAIKAPTLWDAVMKAGMTTAGVSWPVTVGAPINWNVPETNGWPNRSPRGRLDSSRKRSTPTGLFEELEQHATGQLLPEDFDADYLSFDETLARMSGYIIRKYKPNFMAIHLFCLDHFEHEQGRDGDKVRQVVSSADRAVKTILESVNKAGIQDSTAIIILGDHGFCDIHTSLNPNVWLNENGFKTSVQNNKDDWKALFHTSGASAFLHLKNKNDNESLQKVRSILDKLPASTKKLFRVVERAELDLIGADPDVPLALTPVKGITFGGADKAPAIRPASGGTHGYFPDFYEIQTGFIGYGAGFKQGAVIPVMGLQDVAPIVAKLLGIEFNAPDGVLYPGILK